MMKRRITADQLQELTPVMGSSKGGAAMKEYKGINKEKTWQNHRKIKLVNYDQTMIELSSEAMLCFDNGKSELYQSLQQYKRSGTTMPDANLRKRISESIGVPTEELFPEIEGRA